ncbi:MAG: pseudouridine synthase/RluA family pseudouridine synthase [Myxococcota bacterium]
MGRRTWPAIRLSHRDLLWECADAIAVNKRRGWPTHATRDPRRPHLHAALQAFLRNRDGAGAPTVRLHHRLDLHTSGVVLCSTSDRGAKALADLFENRRITKLYRAVVLGDPPDEGELRDWVTVARVDGLDRLVRTRRGKLAHTRFRVVERRDGLTELELELVTGRMHQIRAQCALAGFPLLGDPQYGDAVANARHGVEGQRLHAAVLAFDHPIADGPVRIEAPGEVWPEVQSSHGPRYVLFHKPYGVLCQFTTPRPTERSLADFGLPPDVYPAGRLDKDSEGLLLLTDDGAAQDRLASPRAGKRKVYWVQVERVPDDAALDALRRGVVLKGRRTRPAEARRLEGDVLPPRDPPIRHRLSVPTCWIEIVLTEGQNRQVRRMTAAVGHPTLRLVRVAVAGHRLDGLAAGEHRVVNRL